MSTANRRSPSLAVARKAVGSGDGFASYHVENGRTRTGHIWRHGTGVFCGVDKRIAPQHFHELVNDNAEFVTWLTANWSLGICRACLISLTASTKPRSASHLAKARRPTR